MRRTVIFAMMTLFVLVLSMAAADKKMGVADRRTISFTHPVRIGDALLPAGNYEVRHTMQGEEHVMEFKQLDKKKPAEARVKCTLVPLAATAKQDLAGYKLNATNEYVLTQLVFKGDSAEHHF